MTIPDTLDIVDRCRSGGGWTSLWKLPKLPLTEMFGAYDPVDKLAYDQELVIGEVTGRVQLRYVIDPDVLYSAPNYTYRANASERPSNNTSTFVNFLDTLTRQQQFHSILDVGGNDLTLARLLSPRAMSTAVIDPICAADDGQLIDGIRIFGRTVEDTDLTLLETPPDLVVCRHTLEHIRDPEAVIQKLFDSCSDQCLYVFEVPSFDELLESLRFDAVFHQHLHYFTVESFKKLIADCGGEFISHHSNHRGSCGGSLLIAFQKAKTAVITRKVDIEGQVRMVETRLANFLLQAEVTHDILMGLPKPVFGYGASLMLATLAYHLKTDFSFLECILDDDPSKNMTSYRNVPVQIRYPDAIEIPYNSSFIITSLENIRAIQAKVHSLNPRRCISPIIS